MPYKGCKHSKIPKMWLAAVLMPVHYLYYNSSSHVPASIFGLGYLNYDLNSIYREHTANDFK